MQIVLYFKSYNAILKLTVVSKYNAFVPKLHEGLAAQMTNLVLCLLSLQMNKHFQGKPSVFAICCESVSRLSRAWAQHQQTYNTRRGAYAALRQYLQTASHCSLSLYFQMRVHGRTQRKIPKEPQKRKKKKSKICISRQHLNTSKCTVTLTMSLN